MTLKLLRVCVLLCQESAFLLLLFGFRANVNVSDALIYTKSSFQVSTTQFYPLIL